TASSGPVQVTGFLDVIDEQSDITVLHLNIDSAVNNALLATVNMTTLPGTHYRMELYVQGENIKVPSIRYFTLPGGGEESSSQSEESEESEESTSEGSTKWIMVWNFVWVAVYWVL